MSSGLISRTLRRLTRSAPEAAVAQDFDGPSVLNMLQQADLARDAGDLTGALGMVEQVASSPHHSEAILLRLGILYYLLGRFHDSRASLDAALKIEPDDVSALRYLAATLSMMGDTKSAIAAAERSLVLGPPNAQTINLLGAIHMKQGTYEEAEKHFHRALEIDPNDRAPLENLETLRARFGGARIGVEVHQHTEQVRTGLIASLGAKLRDNSITLDEADHLATLTNNRREHFEWAREIAIRYQKVPHLTASLATTLAIVRQNAGELKEALDLREAALRLAPDSADARGGLGWLLITEGKERWAEGWRLYLESASVLNPRNTPTEVPTWRGEDMSGKKLFVYPDQGMGDAFLALRFVPMLHRRGIDVVLWAPPAIADLAKSIGGYAEFHSSPHRPDPGSLGCTYACGLLGLVAPMGLSRSDLKTPPLLQVPDERRAFWAERFAGIPGRKIALSSSGNPGRIDDWLRSIPTEALSAFAELGGISWINLSVDEREESRTAIARLGMFDAARDFRDFVDAAAVIDACDAVVAIDCAAAHVAGSLGKPLFVLKPTVLDWRWQIADDTTPWWPTSRIYAAEAPGQWTGAVNRLAADLGRFLAASA